PHSIGSPASRSSTKLMPLTTRPSFTSRHGMMRLASIGTYFESSFERDQSLIQSLADNHAIEPWMLHFRQRAHIVDLRDTAGGDETQACPVEHLLERGYVRAHENAVSRNIGVDHELRALVFEPAGELDCAHLRVFRPARHFCDAIASIDADGDP